MACGWCDVAEAEPPAEPPPTAQPPGDAAPTPSPEEVLSRLVRPELIGSTTVEYPAELTELAAPPAGQVVVRFKIGVDGVPRDAAVEQGIHPRLDALALEAVERLRYRPAMLDGVAVEVIDRTAIAFAPPVPDVPPPQVLPPPEPGGDAEEGTPDAATPPLPIRIEGSILEAGQRTPIPGATVVAIPAPDDARRGHVRKIDYGAKPAPAWEVFATTSEDGTFELRGEWSGKVRIAIVAPGYERLEFIEAIAADEAIQVKYYAQRLATNPYRTVVQTENPREEVVRRTITVEEINAIPGTQGDALKSIQNFPGVARAPFGAGALAIRGTGPNDSATYLGHHPIPQLFHFGGLTSVFNSDILERIDFVPGNFDARYGNAIGGIVDVTPRAGRRDGYHGYLDADVFDAGVLFEGKVGKGSFALSGRRSYIDALLPVVVPDDAGLDLSVAPRYYDYQALFDYPLAGGTFSVRAFGSDDRTVLVASSPNEIDTDDRNRFETTAYFHRADLLYTKQKGSWRFLATPSYRAEYFELGLGDILDIDVFSHHLNVRVEFSNRFSSRSELTIGTELQHQWFDVDVVAPPLPDSAGGSTSAELTTEVEGFTANPAIYITEAWKVTPRLTLLPGARISVYTSPRVRPVFEPRVRFRWDVADQTSLKGGTGLFAQDAQPQQLDAVFGNPDLRPEYAFQNSLGVEHRFPFDINLDATAFFNFQWDSITSSTDLILGDDGLPTPENFANGQWRRIYGLEFLLRKELTSNFFGWVAYTLSRSERRNRDGDWVLFDFDQTHILTLIGVYKLPRNWQVGARFRLVSGNPDTPLEGGVFDATSGGYIALPGASGSERFPLFHQLDIRVDKTWIWRRVSWMVYLDVQNVYNAQNVEFWNYGYDFRQRQPIAGLPIIPSLGTKLEF